MFEYSLQSGSETANSSLAASPSSADSPSIGDGRPTIYYIWDYVNWGGAQIYYFGLMKEARKRFNVVAVLPEGSSQRIFDYLNDLSVPFELLPAERKFHGGSGILSKIGNHSSKIRSDSAIMAWARAKGELSNDILHIDKGFWESLFLLKRLSKIANVVYTLHTPLSPSNYFRYLIWKLKGRLVSRLPNFHLMASNKEAANSLSRFISGKSASNVPIAYSGFDPDEVDDVHRNGPTVSETRDLYSIPAGNFLICSVGQFIERKGCWTVLESLKLLKSTRTDFVFLWLGTAAADLATKDRIDSYGLDENFRLLSPSDLGSTRTDLLAVVNACDLFVMASFQEGLPTALVEAMAFGTACIATSVDATPEAVEDDVTGMIVASGDAIDLASKLDRLLADDRLRSRLGIAGKARAYESFSRESSANISVRVYSDILNQRMRENTTV